MGTLLDRPYTSRHATYDLRRLRRKGLIERLPHSHRYQLTPVGRRVAAGWPSWTRRYPPNWLNAAPSPSHGEASTANSTDSSPTGWPPPESCNLI